MTVLWMLLAAAVFLGGRYALVRLYPWKACPRCKGGRVYGGGGHRDCKRCGKTGRVRRWGAPRQEG